MSNNVRLRMEQDEADQIQQQLAEPTGKDIYEYMAANRGARFEDTEEGRRRFNQMKNYMAEKNTSIFAGFGEAIGSMIDEMAGLGRAPAVFFDKNQSLAVSAAEGAARGARDIATIFWQSEDPNSWAFHVKDWIRAIGGLDNGDIRAQMDQYHAARAWNNRTYDYMEGRATALDDVFETRGDFFKRAMDPEFATAFSWIATDIPEWVLSGGVATAGSAIKVAAKGGMEAAAEAVSKAEKARKASYLANQYERISSFAQRWTGKALEGIGTVLQAPFASVYGARASLQQLGGAAAEAAENVATTQILAGARTIAGDFSPAVGVFRSLGVETIGEILTAYGSEMVERASGIARSDIDRVAMTVMDTVASNVAGKTKGALSKEAQALAKGINFTLGWAPSMSSHAIAEASRNAIAGGALGWYNSPDAIGQGMGIGVAYGLGFGSLRHMIAITHYDHSDGLTIKNFKESAIPAAARIHGEKTAEAMRRVLDYWEAKIAQGDSTNAKRMAGVELAALTHLLREGSVAMPTGNIRFYFDDISSDAGRASFQKFLEESGWSESEAKAEASSMSGSRGRFIEPKGVDFKNGTKRRVIAINSSAYNGLTINHEIGHAVLRSAAYKLGYIDENGFYTDEFIRRFVGATKDAGILDDASQNIIGTNLFSLRGMMVPDFSQGFGFEQPSGTVRAMADRKNYSAIMREEMVKAGINPESPEAAAFERANTQRVQDLVFEHYNRTGGRSRFMEALETWRDDFAKGNTAGDVINRGNLSAYIDEVMAYTYGASSLGLPVDYWNKNPRSKNALRALGEFIGERRHTRMIADLELAGVFIKQSFESKGAGRKLLTPEGVPLIQSFAFDNDKVVRFEALDELTTGLFHESADLTEQAIHTLTPEKQEIYAKMTGKTKYFNNVAGGMRIKPEAEREAIALADARKAIAALQSLPDADRPRIEVTEKGFSVKLEDLSVAAWDALEKSGAYTALEINELKGMAATIQQVDQGLNPHNVYNTTLAANTRQVGRGATARRLSGENVPVTYRVFTPLSLELFVNDKTPDGRPSRKQTGGVRVHSYDILALNKRMITMFEMPRVRQYFDSFESFAKLAHKYIAHNSQPAGSRISTIDFLKREGVTGDDATLANIRDILFETFGGRKRKDDSYINTPGGDYKVPGDNRLYPFYTMRFDTMMDTRLSPVSWNHEVKSANFPYVHKLGYDPMTRNNMVMGFVQKPKANGTYLRNRDGFEIHEVKGKFRVYDNFGVKLGDFVDLKRAMKVANKFLEKLPEEDRVPAAVDVGTIIDIETSARTALDMTVGAERAILGAIQKMGGSIPFHARIAGFASAIGKPDGQPLHLRLSDILGSDEVVMRKSDYIGPYKPEVTLRDLTIVVTKDDGSGDYFLSSRDTPSDRMAILVMHENELKEIASLPPDAASLLMGKLLTHSVGKYQARSKNLIPSGDPEISTAMEFVDSIKTLSVEDSMLGDAIAQMAASNPDFLSRMKQVPITKKTAPLKAGPMDQPPGFLGIPWALDRLITGSDQVTITESDYNVVSGISTTSGSRLDASEAVLSNQDNLTVFRAPLQAGSSTNKNSGMRAGFELEFHGVQSSEGTLKKFHKDHIVSGRNPTKAVSDLYAGMLREKGMFNVFSYARELVFSNRASELAGFLGETPSGNIAELSSQIINKLESYNYALPPKFDRIYGSGFSEMLRKQFEKYAISRVGRGKRTTTILPGSVRTDRVKKALHALKRRAERINADGGPFAILSIGVRAGLADVVLGQQGKNISDLGLKGEPVSGGAHYLTASYRLNNQDVFDFVLMKELRETLLDDAATVEEKADAAFAIHNLQSREFRVMHETAYQDRHQLNVTGRRGYRPGENVGTEESQRSFGADFRKGDLPGGLFESPETGIIVRNEESLREERLRAIRDNNEAQIMRLQDGTMLVVYAVDSASYETAGRLPSISSATGQLTVMLQNTSPEQYTGGVAGTPMGWRRDRRGSGVFMVPMANANFVPGPISATALSFGAINTLQTLETVGRDKNFRTQILAAATSYVGEQALRSIIDATKREMYQNKVAGQSSYGALVSAAVASNLNMAHYDFLRHATAYLAKFEILAENPQLTGLSPRALETFKSADGTSIHRMEISRETGQLVSELVALEYASKVPDNVRKSLRLLPHVKRAIDNVRTKASSEQLSFMTDVFKKHGGVFVQSYTTNRLDMIVGSQALRHMEQARRDDLVRRGMVKMIRLGDGTQHQVWELADDRAQLNLRRFGEKLSGVFGNKIPVVAEGQMSLVEAYMITYGHKGLIQKYQRENFGMLKYMSNLPEDHPARVQMREMTAKNDAALMIAGFIDELNKGPHKFTDAAGRELTAPYLLQDIINHPELFELYPNIAKMPVRFTDGIGGQMHGPSNYIGLGIGLFMRDLVAEEGGLTMTPNAGRLPGATMDQFTPSAGKYSYEQSARAVILHEVQHAVQHAEKWKMATPWLAAAVREDVVSAKNFSVLVDQYVAAEKIFGGTKKTRILANVDAEKDMPAKAQVADRLMRTWGSLQEVVSLDPNTEKFVAYASNEESLAALRGIIEAPKSVRLLNEAVPNMLSFLHLIKVNTELQMRMRLAGGELATPELAMLNEWAGKIDDKIQQIEEIKARTIDGTMTRDQAIRDTYEVFSDIQSTFPIALHDPVWSGVATKTSFGAYSAMSDVSKKEADVALMLSAMSAAVESGQALTPERAQILIVQLVNDMRQLFYSASDTEIMARETATRSMMSQAELEATPRRTDFFNPEDAGMYEFAKWNMERDQRGRYLSLDMIGGLLGSPEIEVSARPDRPLNLFAASLRIAARMALNAVYIKAINQEATKLGIYDFSSRGWVVDDDGKLVYRVSTGRYKGANILGQREIMGGFQNLESLTGGFKGLGALGSDQVSKDVAGLFGMISSDGKTITVEDVGRVIGAEVIYDSVMETSSPVMNHLMSMDSSSRFTGGSIMSQLREAGMSDDALRLANIDHVDSAFNGVELSKHELLDLLATTHTVLFESSSEAPADRVSVAKDLITQIKDKAAIGRRIRSLASLDVERKAIVDDILQSIVNQGEETFRAVEGQATENVPGMFMMRCVEVNLMLRQGAWARLYGKLERAGRLEAFQQRLRERAGNPNGNLNRWNAVVVKKFKAMVAGDTETAMNHAFAQAREFAAHVTDIMFAVSDQAEKLYDYFTTNEGNVHMDNLLADACYSLVEGAVEGSNIFELSFGERPVITERAASTRANEVATSGRRGRVELGSNVTMLPNERNFSGKERLRAVRDTRERLGITSESGGLPVRGSITSNAGSNYAQFASGVYAGQAFNLGYPFDLNPLSEGIREYAFTDYLSLAGEKFQGSEQKRFLPGFFESSGVKLEGMADLGNGLGPLREMMQAAIISLTPSTNRFDSMSPSLPAAVDDMRNAGIHLIMAAREHLRTAEILADENIRLHGEEAVPRETVFGPKNINEMLMKARGYARLAHSIAYRADTFPSYSMPASNMLTSGGEIPSYYGREMGMQSSRMTDQQFGTVISASNLGMVRGILDVGAEGQKGLLITNFSTLAEPPTQYEAGLVDIAFGTANASRKKNYGHAAQHVIAARSFDLNTRPFEVHPEEKYRTISRMDHRGQGLHTNYFSDTGANAAAEADGFMPFVIGKMADDIAEGGLAAYLAAQSNDPALAMGILDYVGENAPTYALSGFSWSLPDGALLPKAFYQNNTPSIRVNELTRMSDFEAKSDLVMTGFGQIFAALQSEFSQQDAIKAVKPYVDLVYMMTNSYGLLTDSPVETFSADFWKNYVGRKIKRDDRLLLLAPPTRMHVENPNMIGSTHAMRRFIINHVPGARKAMAESVILAANIMGIRHFGLGSSETKMSRLEAYLKATGDQAERFVPDNEHSLITQALAKDMESTVMRSRFDELVGALFLERTLLKWLNEDPTFMPTIEGPLRQELINAIRLGYTRGAGPDSINPNMFMTDAQREVFGIDSKGGYGINFETNGRAVDVVRRQLYGQSMSIAKAFNSMNHAQRHALAVRLAKYPGLSARSRLTVKDGKIYIPQEGDAAMRLGEESAVRVPIRASNFVDDMPKVNVEQAKVEFAELVDYVDEPYFLSNIGIRGFGSGNIVYDHARINTGQLGRLPNYKLLDEKPAEPHTHHISAEPVSPEKGGMVAAMVMDSVNNDWLFEGQSAGETAVTTVSASVPRTSVSSQLARSTTHEAVVRRMVQSGADHVDISPASSIVSRVSYDVLQAAHVNTLGRRLTNEIRANQFSMRGQKSIAKTISRPYGGEEKMRRLDDVSYTRAPSDIIEASGVEPTRNFSVGSPFSLTEQGYSKGYAWSRRPDGSIIINISGDHLGYKTGMRKQEWGFSLSEGVGYDPRAGIILPGRFEFSADMYDILSRIGMPNAGIFDPLSPAVNSAHEAAAKTHLRRPVSSFRREMFKDRGLIVTTPYLDLNKYQSYSVRNPGDEALHLSKLDEVSSDPAGHAILTRTINGAYQSGSYATIVIPPGATAEQIKAQLLSIHAERHMQMAVLGASSNGAVKLEGPRVQMNMSYARSISDHSSRSREFAGPNTASEAILRKVIGEGGAAGEPTRMRFALQTAMQLDPHLVADVEVLVGKIVTGEKGYYLPDSERALRVHGDTGVAVATMFPGRPDLMKYSWDNKNAAGIQTFKRGVPRGVDPAGYHAFVVAFPEPITMTPEGSLRMGSKAVAFKTAAEAETFANRMSMQLSGSDLVKALASGDVEIVARPGDLDADTAVAPKLIQGQTFGYGTAGNGVNLMDVAGTYQIGDSDLVIPGLTPKSAKNIERSLRDNRHIRFKSSAISLDMAMGLTTKQDFRDLVSSKLQFGLPQGPIRFASKAMNAILDGKWVRRGVTKDFEGLTGGDWLIFLREIHAVTKDELRQSGLGALLAINKDRTLTRTEVAEFFAHLYPTMIRNDFALTAFMLKRGNRQFIEGGNRGVSGSVLTDNIMQSYNNQLHAVRGLSVKARELVQLQSWLLNKSDMSADSPEIAQLNRVITVFDQMVDKIGESIGATLGNDSLEMKLDNLRLHIENMVTDPELRKFDEGLSAAQYLERKIELFQETNYEAFEKARLALNDAMSLETLSGRYVAELSGAFGDIEPLIKHAMAASGEVRSAMKKHMSITAEAGTPYFRGDIVHDLSSPEYIINQPALIGQAIGGRKYEHSGYVTGDVHSQMSLAVDYANRVLPEMVAYREELKQRYGAATNPEDKAKIEGLISAVESVIAARTALMQGPYRSHGHFGSDIGGLYSPYGLYEIGHLRQSHVLATARPSVEAMSTPGAIGGLMTPFDKVVDSDSPLSERSLSYEIGAEHMIVIEEIQSDLFQNILEIADFEAENKVEKPAVMAEAGLAMGTKTDLPVTPADLQLAERAEIAKQAEAKVIALRAQVENLDKAVAEGIVQDIASPNNNNSSIRSLMTRNMFESIDLVSRGFLPLQFPGMMRPTGRKVAMGPDMRKKLESLGAKPGEGLVDVMDFDFELYEMIENVAMTSVGPARAKLTERISARFRENANMYLATLPEQARQTMIGANGGYGFVNNASNMADTASHIYDRISAQLSQSAHQQSHGWVFNKIVQMRTNAAAVNPNGYVHKALAALAEMSGQGAMHHGMALISAAIVVDPQLHAVLRGLANDLTAYDYEALAKRAVETIRAMYADSRSVTARSTMTVLDRLLLMPSRDRARTNSVSDTMHVENAGRQVFSLQVNQELVQRIITEDPRAAQYLDEKVKIAIEQALIQLGIGPEDPQVQHARLIITPPTKARMASDMVKPFVFRYGDVDSINKFIEIVRTQNETGFGPYRSMSDVANLLRESTVSIQPSYRGSMAGDFAMSVVSSLLGYERANDISAELARRETEYAELSKGIPARATQDKVMSPSTPLVDDAMTVYKKQILNHAVVESINRGHKAIGMMDAQYQMTRGGSMDNVGQSIGCYQNHFRATPIIVAGARGQALRFNAHGSVESRKAHRLADSLTNAISVLSIIEGGEIKWDPNGIMPRLRQIENSVNGIHTMPNGRTGTIVHHIVAEMKEKIVQHFGEEKAKAAFEAISVPDFGEETMTKLLFLDWKGENNGGPLNLLDENGKPQKYDSKQQKMVQKFMAGSPAFQLPFRFYGGSGAAFGYILNYGLPEAAIRFMFPGAPRKETNLFNIEAFERPVFQVDGNVHSVIDAKTGKPIAQIDVSPEGSTPEQVQKNLQRVREAYLKGSKYVGGNVYIKTFLGEWGKAGGYVDFRVAGALQHQMQGAPSLSPLENAGALFPGPNLQVPGRRMIGNQIGMKEIQKRQLERMESVGILPGAGNEGSMAATRVLDFDRTDARSTKANIVPYAHTNSHDATAAGEFTKVLFGESFVTHNMSVNALPSFITMHHTPVTRSPAEIQAYKDKVRDGIFLQMITGTDALKRKDEVSMRKVSRYLANAGHIPRIRPEEDETADR